MTHFKNEILNNNLKIIEDNLNLTILDDNLNEKRLYRNTPWDITYILSKSLTSQIKKGLIKADDPELNAHYDFLINKHGEVFLTNNLVQNNNCVFWLTYKFNTCYHAVPWYTESNKLKDFFENKDCVKSFTIDLKDLDNYCVVPNHIYEKNIFKKLTNKK
jgi:hypothetical protein